ncbi:MAG: hypothetical protein ABI051_02125 [Vicinamibacterales bacterium]
MKMRGARDSGWGHQVRRLAPAVSIAIAVGVLATMVPGVVRARGGAADQAVLMPAEIVRLTIGASWTNI